ncbi:hypothetical protein NHX12_012348 [Muraenolepis orangiensis]|uniref:Reverse transcriptase domain-containing protein n=1 Tax=Muraenolepis orangiensis TaxID=630683 RepID=A0A9Q0I712_9TELE|nr:hypothetical protein NHX12_012348 [Muraenolepis orangiensis]
MSELQLKEVREVVRKARASSAPGPSGTSYKVYKYCPKLLLRLWYILRVFWRRGRIPDQWRVAEGVWIPKEENSTQLDQFRIISLLCVEAKVFFSAVSKRLCTYLAENNYIDTSVQKGGISGMPGCLEHTGVVTQLIREARENKGNLSVLWLDLENAFGSIPHKLVQFTLTKHHVPSRCRDLIADYYSNFRMRVSSGEITSSWHNVEIGIITGCTISVTLFSLAMNMLTKSAEPECRGPRTNSGQRQPPIRAFMDDLTVMTESVPGCRWILKGLEELVEWARMRFKPAKSRSMVLRKGKVVDKFRFNIADTAIPSISEKPVKSLGKVFDCSLRDTTSIQSTCTELDGWLKSVDKSGLPGKFKAWVYQHGILPRILWPLLVYAVPISTVETLERRGVSWILIGGGQAKNRPLVPTSSRRGTVVLAASEEAAFRRAPTEQVDNERNASLAQRAAAAGDIMDGGLEVIQDGVCPPAPGESAEDRRRKLSCLAAVLQREAREDPESQVKTARVVSRREERAQLMQDLVQIRALQDRSKAEAISSMLSHAITTRHALYASLGTAEYVEFVLRNPFNAPHTVSIHSSDPELSVITSVEQWSHFKALTGTSTPLEENLFQVEEGSPEPRVYLRPRETVHIPLMYQTFVCDHSAPGLQGPGFPPSGRQRDVARKNPSNIVCAKSIKVTFKAEDGKPLAVLQVEVEPTPHLVGHSFRLYHPQHCLLKKALRIPPALGSLDGGEDEISVRCSDPEVICQTKVLAPGEPQDVYLKVPGSASPNVKMFYIMLFTDRWLACPASIWRVHVHFLERVEVSCVAGQRSMQSLVLRGTRATRRVEPSGVFALPPAGGVQELQVRVQPWRAGSRLAFVSAVDVERCRLLAAWMVCLNAHRPILSKAFEVQVPVGGGRGSTRRITYTNPYPDSRLFLLHSDRPDLLQFKEDRFQVGGGEVHTIGLRFAPSQSGGSTEISVYVNNPDERTEETFCLKVNYS